MANRPERTIGEALVDLLAAYGVDRVFGIPGVHNIEMYRALPRSNIRHILPRHEQGAGFMADGYARATGKPGVCFTITGPGLLNILTPLGQAWSDSSPVLVISSALDRDDAAQGRGRLHEMLDQQGAAATVTSLAMRAYTAKDVQDCLAQAFASFASSRPRPAYLEIPLDVLKLPAGDGWQARTLPERPTASAQQLAMAAARLNAARNVVMILGGGALGAGQAAVQIAEQLNARMFTTTAGKGAVPAYHPLCAGARLGETAIQQALLQADCILAAGTELAETDFWNPGFIISQNLIRIDLDPATSSRPHTAEIAILADAATSLSALQQLLTIRAPLVPAPLQPPALAAPFEMAGADDLRQMFITLLNVVRGALPENTIIASDMTQIAYAANAEFAVSTPRTWLHPVGFGTLGFALPAAIGARLGCPNQPAALLIGDYGLQFTLAELGTAVEHHLPLVILLWNNNALGQIRDGMVQAGIQPNAVTLRNPDFQLLAKAYGITAEKPASLPQLQTAIARALTASGPTLIEMTPAMVHG